MSTPLLAIGAGPLALEPLADAVSREDPASGRDGALVTFVGLVRNHNQGRRVLYLEYEAYAPLALKTFARIDEEARQKWPSVRIALHHRTGKVEIGEASVVIAAASSHRADAFAACRYVIERVKQIAPIWKHEHFEGGDVWIEGAIADPTDDRVRAEAERLACA
jgi:molybdopterin synthase catalytic subunit